MAEEPVDNNASIDVSTERFIEEVRIQPAIWNLGSSEYGNRMEKVKAWEQLCNNLIPTFSNLDSKGKNEKVVQLQKRWKGLRSCFNREKKNKKNLKSGSAATARKEYQYYNQMSFLASMSKIRPKTNPPEKVPQKSPMGTSKPRMTTSNTLENEVACENDILKSISEALEKKHEVVVDHDQNFLNSLLPHFKKVPDEFKLDLQSEILYTLKRYVNVNRPNNSQQYGYFTNGPTTSSLSQYTAAGSPADTTLS